MDKSSNLWWRVVPRSYNASPSIMEMIGFKGNRSLLTYKWKFSACNFSYIFKWSLAYSSFKVFRSLWYPYDTTFSGRSKHSVLNLRKFLSWSFYTSHHIKSAKAPLRKSICFSYFITSAWSFIGFSVLTGYLLKPKHDILDAFTKICNLIELFDRSSLGF